MGLARYDEPRIVQIADGVYAQIGDKSAGLPRHLAPADHDGKMRRCYCTPLRSAMTVLRELPVRIRGTRSDCKDDHALQPWLHGVYAGLELLLSVCAFCGVTEVRDVSYDILPGLRPGRSGPRRGSDVLGWYSGRRVAGRVYV